MHDNDTGRNKRCVRQVPYLLVFSKARILLLWDCDLPLTRWIRWSGNLRPKPAAAALASVLALLPSDPPWKAEEMFGA